MTTKRALRILPIIVATLIGPSSLQSAETKTADVIVVGATPAGVAAAVAAGRGGAKVILLEESGHIGGVVSGGLTIADIRKHGSVGGLWNEFKRRIVEHYTQTFGAESENVRVCRGGNMFEPHVAEKVFRAMLAEEQSIAVFEKQRVVAARVIGSDGVEKDAIKGKRHDGKAPEDFGPTSKLVSVSAEDLTNSGAKTEFRAAVFIDATYEGDLAALSGVPYRVGRESRADFGEPHAGKIYVRFKDYNPLPGSTGAADNGIQAFCFRFHLTKNKDNMVPVAKPDNFDRADFQNLLAQMAAGKVTSLRQIIQFYPMPAGKFQINSDHPDPQTGVPAESLDLAEDNWGWPEAGPEERARIFKRYWAHNEGLLWMLQHDEAVPASIRDEAKQWGFPKDEFIDNNNRPHHIYVRQGRRIWGEYTYNENDARPTFETGLPKRQADGVAVAEYEFDSHAVSKYDPTQPFTREGYVFVAAEPTQLPYRMFVPKCVDGLLVPVAHSSTHIGYQRVRMEPLFMAIGEACGIAAHAAQQAKTEVRAVNVPAVQREIVKRGGVILYENTALVPEGL